jgi:hypothetical protein
MPEMCRLLILNKLNEKYITMVSLFWCTHSPVHLCIRLHIIKNSSAINMVIIITSTLLYFINHT